MVLLNNPRSGLLDALRVRYIVSEEEQPAAVGRECCVQIIALSTSDVYSMRGALKVTSSHLAGTREYINRNRPLRHVLICVCTGRAVICVKCASKYRKEIHHMKRHAGVYRRHRRSMQGDHSPHLKCAR
jgi:hypothetical protein